MYGIRGFDSTHFRKNDVSTGKAVTPVRNVRVLNAVPERPEKPGRRKSFTFFRGEYGYIISA